MKKTKSIWGNPPKRLYRLIDLAENNIGKDFNACIVGCSDGKFLLPFARKGIKVEREERNIEINDENVKITKTNILYTPKQKRLNKFLAF